MHKNANESVDKEGRQEQIPRQGSHEAAVFSEWPEEAVSDEIERLGDK